MTPNPKEPWLYEISAKRKLIDLNFKEIWRYRDLLILFVKRDITTVYKQTILGPLWVWLVIKEQPSFETIIGGVVIVATIGVHAYFSLKKNIVIN